ncbi:MAG: hypothetical protein HFJ30_07290 [Clostridia bacterium]|nr:hypothetical protein [Clostridia bacterium]
MEDESMLKVIFETREKELALINKEDKRFMKEHNISRSKKRYYLGQELKKIPYNLKWLKASIEKLLDDYIETINPETSYFCEKYYMAGLKDGIRLREELK